MTGGSSSNKRGSADEAEFARRPHKFQKSKRIIMTTKQLRETVGDLLQSKAHYIAHQANCRLMDGRAKGVAAGIYEKWEYGNVYWSEYGKRTPGECWLMEPGQEGKSGKSNNPIIVNLFGQDNVGQPGKGKCRDETKEVREGYFRKSLLDFLRQLPECEKQRSGSSGAEPPRRQEAKVVAASKPVQMLSRDEKMRKMSSEASTGAVVLKPGPKTVAEDGQQENDVEAARSRSGSVVLKSKEEVAAEKSASSAAPPRPSTDSSGEDEMFSTETSSKADVEVIQEPQEIVTIAFPKNIGCGLAGGDWNKYEQMLEEFAREVQQKLPGKKWEVTIYELPEEAAKGKGKKGNKKSDKNKNSGAFASGFGNFHGQSKGSGSAAAMGDNDDRAGSARGGSRSMWRKDK
ncbi:unnamed protein product [Amoebophrya sp. A120]|nr:unnamed protein product [Amoebophrya sp. A120]|eukprot:GSA120T00002754001.1